MLDRALGEPGPQRGRAEQVPQGTRVADGVVPVDKDAGHTILDGSAQPANRRRDHRGATGLGLDGDQAEDSEYDGTMTTVAARYQSASSDCGQGGSTRTTSSIPRASETLVS